MVKRIPRIPDLVNIVDINRDLRAHVDELIRIPHLGFCNEMEQLHNSGDRVCLASDTRLPREAGSETESRGTMPAPPEMAKTPPKITPHGGGISLWKYAPPYLVTPTGGSAGHPELLDWIFVCNTPHHIDNRSDYLKILSRYLRSGGRLVGIDFRNDLETWTKRAGHIMLEQHQFLEENFLLDCTCETFTTTLE